MEEEEADFAAAPNQVESTAPIIEELPSENNEKAIVLFKPIISPPFFSLPSELICGFKGTHFDYPFGFPDDFRLEISVI